MSGPTQHTQNQSHAEAHEHGGAGLYIKTLVALLILTIITVGAASIDFGSGNVVIALTIASIKATLVALYFMHLRYEKAVNGLIAVTGFLFLGIFLMFCLLDVGSRENLQPVNLRPPLAPPAAAANGAAPGTTPANGATPATGAAPAEGGGAPAAPAVEKK